MKISVVTISYNQAQYLRACLDSVLEQKSESVEVEYIVVDPGSNDGSREILSEYEAKIHKKILEGDSGPADGLNKGFSEATGDIFYYLNSDDIVLEGAFEEVAKLFAAYPDIDIVAGSGVFLNSNGSRLRRVWPDPVGRVRMAYGGSILVQPATFIRSSAFRKVGGFNTANSTNWDGELVTDLFLSGANFKLSNKIWGGYRLHPTSITSSGKLIGRMKDWQSRRLQKLGIHFPPWIEKSLRSYYRFERILRHPSIILGRLKHGRVFGGA
jgi:glycosyltransferase involved in cell wall biosynthesis